MNRNSSVTESSSSCPATVIARCEVYLPLCSETRMRLGTSQDLEGHINVTPMIDVLLVLLVIFMLAIQLRMILPVNVPAPAAEPGRAAGPQLVLELKADGSYALNQATVDLPHLPARLRELFGDGTRKVLYVSAAPQRRYREVIEMVDIARGAGVPIVGYTPRP
jgi:biopolymer transport protein ExbD